MFAVDDIDDTLARLRPTAPNSSVKWRNTSYRLCCRRGPARIVLAPAKQIG